MDVHSIIKSGQSGVISHQEKCKVVDGRHVHPCWSLQQMSEGMSSGKRKGIFVWPFTNINTGQLTRTIYGAVSSAYPKGLIFNWCPWCGTDLREPNQLSGKGES